MKRQEELVQQYLQGANGDPCQAAKAIKRDIETLPLPISAEELIAHLMARDKLTELAEQVNHEGD